MMGVGGSAYGTEVQAAFLSLPVECGLRVPAVASHAISKPLIKTQLSARDGLIFVSLENNDEMTLLWRF